MSRARSVSQLVGANTALGNTVITGTANVTGAVTFSNTLSVASNTLLGTTTTTNNLRLNQKLAVVTTGSGIFGGASLTSYPGTVNVSPIIDLQRSRGTTDNSMTAVASGDILGYGPVFRGADGTNFVDAAYIQGAVDGTVSTGIVPGRLTFNTSNASGTNQEVMRIDSSGRITLPFNPSFCYWQSDASGSAQNPTVNNGVVVFRGSSNGGQHNRGSYYNTSSGRFTAPVTGTYHFDYHWIMNAATVAAECNYAMRINGGAFTVDGRCRGYVESSGHVSVNLYLNASDYVEILKSDTTGISMYPTDRYSWFSGYLVG